MVIDLNDEDRQMIAQTLTSSSYTWVCDALGNCAATNLTMAGYSGPWREPNLIQADRCRAKLDQIEAVVKALGHEELLRSCLSRRRDVEVFFERRTQEYLKATTVSFT